MKALTEIERQLILWSKSIAAGHGFPTRAQSQELLDYLSRIPSRRVGDRSKAAVERERRRSFLVHETEKYIYSTSNRSEALAQKKEFQKLDREIDAVEAKCNTSPDTTPQLNLPSIPEH